jgi:hypothetical protein
VALKERLIRRTASSKRNKGGRRRKFCVKQKGATKMAKRKPADAQQVRAFLWTCSEEDLTAAINEGVMARASRFPRKRQAAKAAVAKHRRKQQELDEGAKTPEGAAV